MNKYNLFKSAQQPERLKMYAELIGDYKICRIKSLQDNKMSGIWTDYRVTVPEDQTKFTIPLNRDTEKLYTDQRMIIDARVLTEPKTWKISKINRLSPNGLIVATLAQTQFDSETDYIEKNEFGNVVGMWASYWKKGVEPMSLSLPQLPDNNIHSTITYSGIDPIVRINGNQKSFFVKFYDEIGQVRHRHGVWRFAIDGEDVSSLVEVLGDKDEIKVRFVGSDDYIGKDLVVSYESADGIKSSVTMNVQGL